jgi:arsenate reductase
MSGRLKIVDLLEAERRAVLFVDKTNTTCSQMADGFASYLSPTSMQIFSAGLVPGSIDALTVSVMKESGIDVTKARAKSVAAIPLEQIAVLVSLCEIDDFPEFPDHIKHLPIPIADPALAQGSETDLLEAYRNARNQVRELVSTLL